ncbi:MAG: N-formylglutamate amidohydrolase [Pseudoruegeria sp.]
MKNRNAKKADCAGQSVELWNADGKGQVVLLCEHASHTIPDGYDGLGLRHEDLRSHAAWDPGARALSVQLSKALDAVLVASKVSRLVYDCNRPPEDADAMRVQSELISIPGNVGLSAVDRDVRIRTVYQTFCSTVDDVLDARGPQTVVVTVHSFTPVYYGKRRSVEIGLLHDTDSRLADAMLAYTDRVPGVMIERNAPYGPHDGVTHSLKIHACSRGLANVMIEVRNDLLATTEQVRDVAHQILTLLLPALEEFEFKGNTNA